MELALGAARTGTIKSQGKDGDAAGDEHPRAKPSTRGLLGLIGVPPPCSLHRTHLLGWRWPVLRPAQELGTAICRAGLATTLCRAGLGSADVDPTPWGDGSQCLLSGSPPQSLRMLMEGGGGECKSLCPLPQQMV